MFRVSGLDLEFQDNAIVVDGIAPLTHPLARTTLARTPLWQYGRSLGTTRRGTTPYPLRGTAYNEARRSVKKLPYKHIRLEHTPSSVSPANPTPQNKNTPHPQKHAWGGTGHRIPRQRSI